MPAICLLLPALATVISCLDCGHLLLSVLSPATLLPVAMGLGPPGCTFPRGGLCAVRTVLGPVSDLCGGMHGSASFWDDLPASGRLYWFLNAVQENATHSAAETTHMYDRTVSGGQESGQGLAKSPVWVLAKLHSRCRPGHFIWSPNFG